MALGYGVPAEMSIVNRGLRPDDYGIILDGPDWAYISDDSFHLVPLQEETFYLYLSPPYGTPEKEYVITVLAKSENTLAGVEIVALVTSEPEGNVTQNVTVEIINATRLVGVTGLFLDFERVPLEAAAIAALAVASVLILVMRFVIFR